MNEPGFTDDIYARLTAICTPIQVLANDELPEAEIHGPIGFVSAGRLAVVVDAEAGRTRTIALLQEGDAMALTAGGWPGAPGARVRAATDAELLVLTDALDDVLCRDAALAAWIIRALAFSVADRELSAAIALEPRLERRLILKLRQLAERWGKVTPEGVRLDLRVTHQELGDMIGAARESITVALGRLQEQGEITVRRRTVILRHMEDQAGVATESA
ncbi:MAG: Crp/Fnr family transcriptional regulator [Acidobacteria bacterium]|nr:Crp/Fnr family transcriptional regulator [Acidobacteriota bacterium]